MWHRIRDFFRDSETIAWARVQMLLGIIAELLTFVPPELWAPVLPPKWFGLFLLFNGIATEYLRKRRADDLK